MVLASSEFYIFSFSGSEMLEMCLLSGNLAVLVFYVLVAEREMGRHCLVSAYHP
jgi:hypothetical protein